MQALRAALSDLIFLAGPAEIEGQASRMQRGLAAEGEPELAPSVGGTAAVRGGDRRAVRRSQGVPSRGAGAIGLEIHFAKDDVYWSWPRLENYGIAS